MRLESQRPGQPHRFKTGDFLSLSEPAEPPLEFDVHEVVPAEVWDRLRSFLEQAPDTRYDGQLPLIRLAVFDPTLAQVVRTDTDLPGRIQSNIRRNCTDNGLLNLDVSIELSKYLELFPSLAFPHEFDPRFKQIVEIYWEGSIPYVFNGLRALLMCFPERKGDILQLMSDEHLWERALEELMSDETMYGALPSLKHEPRNALSVIADLIVLLPEKTQELITLIRPYWADVQAAVGGSALLAMQEGGYDRIDYYVSGVMQMQRLSVLSHKKPLESPMPLPQRQL